MTTLYPIDYHSYHSTVSSDDRVRFLIFHYTAVNFAESITRLASAEAPASAHYLVPDPTDVTYQDAGFKDVRIFNLVDEQHRAWHAGISAWKNYNNLNYSSIGIENVNLAEENENGSFIFPPFNPEQMNALKQLSLNIIQRYPDILPTHVLGHSDIAPGRKNDPGPMFPWEDFYHAGIGAWYDADTKAKYEKSFSDEKCFPAKEVLLERFAKYGYDTSQASANDTDYQQLTRAFQMHFRPAKYDGVVDIETAAILFALVEKYFPAK